MLDTAQTWADGIRARAAGRTVLLANGAFPSHPLPRFVLDSAARIVCCDGAAAKFAAASGRLPDLVVGDLDSLDEVARAALSGRMVEVVEQESNDLTKAFCEARRRAWEPFVVLGATGLREDHTLGNLALLADYAREADVFLLTDTGVFDVLEDSGELSAYPGQAVSVFALDGRAALTSEGLRYPLAGCCYPHAWQATLNVAETTIFRVATAGGPVLVFRAFMPG